VWIILVFFVLSAFKFKKRQSTNANKSNSYRTYSTGYVHIYPTIVGPFSRHNLCYPSVTYQFTTKRCCKNTNVLFVWKEIARSQVYCCMLSCLSSNTKLILRGVFFPHGLFTEYICIVPPPSVPLVVFTPRSLFLQK
jgi:hypothetical protein